MHVCDCTGTTVNIYKLLHLHLLLAVNNTVPISILCGGNVRPTEFRFVKRLCCFYFVITRVHNVLNPRMFYL